MNNTEKLLRAFIEASGYEIKEAPVITYGRSIKAGDWGISAAVKGEFEFFPATDKIIEAEYREVIRDINYKITKKSATNKSPDMNKHNHTYMVVNSTGDEYNVKAYNHKYEEYNNELFFYDHVGNIISAFIAPIAFYKLEAIQDE